ncbi:MAG: hypothetical protein NZL90_04750 [Aquificaceae bacterium]|nr:hypothetical protein [Aquificaceae bacterium]MDW8237806.1 hypothetical protein [Aquificaceae bacterium]
MRYTPLALVIAGLIISVFGQWIALSLYLNNKLKRQAENMAAFAVAVATKSPDIELPNPEENLIVVRSPINNLFVQTKIEEGQDESEFVSIIAKSDDGSTQANIYYKGISVSEFLSLIKSDLISLLFSFGGIIMAVFGIIWVSKAGPSKPIKEKSSGITITRSELKALKLAIAFGGIIPKQSLMEAKSILEGIIKRAEGK